MSSGVEGKAVEEEKSTAGSTEGGICCRNVRDFGSSEDCG